MRKSFIATTLVLGVLVYSAPVYALSGEAAEVESARANARAGGPTNARDAELLERHGCLSGSRSSFCRRLAHRDEPRYKRRRYRHRDRD